MIDKPSKRESTRRSKNKNCSVNQVEQTVKYSDEHVNTTKEIQSTLTESINNAENNPVQQNNKAWWKGNTFIFRFSITSGLIEKKMYRNRKI